MNADLQYHNILRDILKNGTEKETRSGKVISVFGRTMRFNLKNGLPLLTTKKVYTKGIIHELLWFISGNTNVKYLVDNDVNIWTDDAFRYFREKCNKSTNNKHLVVMTKEDFVKHIKNSDSETFMYETDNSIINEPYRYGDMGKIYSKQWRDWEDYYNKNVDQLSVIIDTLKHNPDDRRIILSAWNVADIVNDRMGLPPCHVFAQFYSRKLRTEERLQWLWDNCNSNEYDEWKNPSHETLDNLNVPRRGLSCSFTMRSNDFFLGNPYNIASYAILTHMIAQCVGMDVDELIFVGNDVHLYENHLDAVNEQLERNPFKYNAPKLWLNPEIKDINKFKFDDVKILKYESYPSIKAPLSVG